MSFPSGASVMVVSCVLARPEQHLNQVSSLFKTSSNDPHLFPRLPFPPALLPRPSLSPLLPYLFSPSLPLPLTCCFSLMLSLVTEKEPGLSGRGSWTWRASIWCSVIRTSGVYLQKWLPLEVQVTIGIVHVNSEFAASICGTSLGGWSCVPEHDGAGWGGGHDGWGGHNGWGGGHDG